MPGSRRGPRFVPQYACGGSQPCVTLVPSAVCLMFRERHFPTASGLCGLGGGVRVLGLGLDRLSFEHLSYS